MHSIEFPLRICSMPCCSNGRCRCRRWAQLEIAQLDGWWTHEARVYQGKVASTDAHVSCLLASVRDSIETLDLNWRIIEIHYEVANWARTNGIWPSALILSELRYATLVQSMPTWLTFCLRDYIRTSRGFVWIFNYQYSSPAVYSSWREWKPVFCICRSHMSMKQKKSYICEGDDERVFFVFWQAGNNFVSLNVCSVWIDLLLIYQNVYTRRLARFSLL